DPTLTLEDVKKQLIEKGKKEGHLSHEEIAEKLQNFDIDSDQMDDFFDQLNDNDISLVNEKDSSDTDEKLNPSDLSAPPGVKINDPVRMYLKEIGRVNLL
ncbi:RNA polymerase sigma factor RpoD, partial [Staphylococcus aureus]|nr:RNA polymerase sigma factor RpoD [Staphylococcus aureus]